MRNFLHNYYDNALTFLQFLGGSPEEFSLGYQIVNLLIFMFIQPSLILLFFILWRREKKKTSKCCLNK